MKTAIGILYFRSERIIPENTSVGPLGITFKVNKIEPEIHRVIEILECPEKEKSAQYRCVYRLPLIYKTALPIVLIAEKNGVTEYDLTWMNISHAQSLVSLKTSRNPEAEGYVALQGSSRSEIGDWKVATLLKCAEIKEKPLVENPSVAHILADLQVLAPDLYRKKFDSRKRESFQSMQDFFIAVRWKHWDANSIKYSDRIKEMELQGLWITRKSKNVAEARDHLRIAEKTFERRVSKLKKSTA